jgi:hypothetical protein
MRAPWCRSSWVSIFAVLIFADGGEGASESMAATLQDVRNAMDRHAHHLLYFGGNLDSQSFHAAVVC